MHGRAPDAGSSSMSRCSRGRWPSCRASSARTWLTASCQSLGHGVCALLPYQTFRTKTRDLALGVGSDKLWRTFCPLLGRDASWRSAIRDQRGARGQPRQLIDRLQQTFLTRAYEEWEPILLRGGRAGWRREHNRSGRGAPASGRTWLAGRVGAPRRGRDPRGRSAGALVRHAGRRARPGAVARASTPTRCCATGSGSRTGRLRACDGG